MWTYEQILWSSWIYCGSENIGCVSTKFNNFISLLICLLQDAWQDVTLYGETDAYIVVYSVTDKETFDEAVDVLYEIRKSPDRSNAAIILVANKNDMVRNRDVTIEG